MVYGGSCGCGNGGSDNGSDNSNTGCNGADLFDGVSKNDCVKVFLNNAHAIKGYFGGISGNTVSLFTCDRSGISTTVICLDDVSAVRTFSRRDCACE